MLMNNRSVIGFYIWSDAGEYEKGDFVVKGDCIYKCTALNPTNKENFTVIGKDPAVDRENYSIYPGEMITTADEYFKYVEEMKDDSKEQPEDKFVSMHVLYEILQKLYFGVSCNGVVDNYVLKTEEGINFLVSGVTDLDKSTEPIDIILQSPSLNNGVLKVSREFFPGLFITEPSEIEGATNYYSSKAIDNSVVILRQYTYDYKKSESEEVIRRRTQELVDPVYGDIFIRYSDGVKNEGTGEYIFPSSSSWKRVSIGNDNIRTTLTSVHNTYQNMYDSYKEKTESEGTFFKTIYPTKLPLSEFVTNSYPSADVWLPDQSGAIDFSSTRLGGCLYTVVVSTSLRNGLYKNSNLTFDGLELNTEDGVKTWWLSDSVSLRVTRVKYESIGLRFEVLSNNDVLESVITNIYCKKNNE